ncbi:MAG: hypothetical protein K6L81_01895 [Agarilytica sp.]
MSSSSIVEVFQGDTTTIQRVRPSVLALDEVIASPWECRQNVIDHHGNVVVESSEITSFSSDQLRWLVALTPSQTQSLPVEYNEPYSKYIWVIQVSNPDTTPPFSVEKHIELRVKKQGLS